MTSSAIVNANTNATLVWAHDPFFVWAHDPFFVWVVVEDERSCLYFERVSMETFGFCTNNNKINHFSKQRINIRHSAKPKWAMSSSSGRQSGLFFSFSRAATPAKSFSSLPILRSTSPTVFSSDKKQTHVKLSMA